MFSPAKLSRMLEPVYHQSPIDPLRTLVTFDWGADFTDFIQGSSRMSTTVYVEVDRSKGLDPE